MPLLSSRLMLSSCWLLNRLRYFSMALLRISCFSFYLELSLSILLSRFKQAWVSIYTILGVITFLTFVGDREFIFSWKVWLFCRSLFFLICASSSNSLVSNYLMTAIAFCCTGCPLLSENYHNYWRQLVTYNLLMQFEPCFALSRGGSSLIDKTRMLSELRLLLQT